MVQPVRIPIPVRRIAGRPHQELPRHETPGSAGMDLRASLLEPLVLQPHRVYHVPTGLALELPEGYEGQVRPRSGLAMKRGVTVANAPGTIDSDYRGEVGVLLVNLTDSPVEIVPGERIAQLVLSPVVQGELVEVTELNETQRGSGGFGHTGRD